VEVDIKELSTVSHEVEITATAEDLKPHFDKAYDEYRKKIEIRGFRKGHAPLDLIKKLYGDLIEHDSLEDIAGEFYRQTVKEKELKPIGEPELVDMNYEPGKEFKFKIRYDVRPAITLQNYKGITITKPVHTVTDAEVEDEILHLRREKATMVPVDKVTDPEHIVTVDVQELDESGAPIIGRKDTNIRLYLADERLSPEYKEHLKDAVVGGVYPIKFELNRDGQPYVEVNELTVTKIEKVQLPELDDKFVEDISNGEFHTVEELRQDVKKKLENYWKEQSERRVKNDLINELLRIHDFQVPESLIRSVLNQLLEDVKNEYPGKKLPEDFDTEAFFKRNRAYAIAQSKWALLREELLKAENITVTDEELEKYAEVDAERIKIPKERIVQYYKSSEQILDRFMGEKLMKTLLDSAVITEVPEEELKPAIIEGDKE